MCITIGLAPVGCVYPVSPLMFTKGYTLAMAPSFGPTTITPRWLGIPRACIFFPKIPTIFM